MAFGVARGVQYASIALAVGTVFPIAIWLPALALVAGAGEWRTASERFRRRARGVMLLAVIAGVLSGAAGIVLQGATAAGVTFVLVGARLHDHRKRPRHPLRHGPGHPGARAGWGSGRSCWAL